MSDASFGHRSRPDARRRWEGAPSVLSSIVSETATADMWTWARRAFNLGVDVLVVFFFMVLTTALVSFPTKLANGAPIGWAGWIWLVGVAVGVLTVLLRPWRSIQTGLLLVPFVLVTGWVWASLAWSANTYETLRGAVFLTGSHLAAVGIAARYSWEKILKLLAGTLAILISISAGLAIAVPSIGTMRDIHVGAWSGLWLEKQALGFFAGHLIVASTALALYGRRNWIWLVFVPVGLITLVFATGRTAMLMTALGLSVLVFGWLLQRSPRIAIATGWLGVVGAGLAGLIVAFAADQVLKLLGRSSDLTGRTELWESVREVIGHAPSTGVGYQAIWRGAEDLTSPYQWIMSYTGFEPANAHSSWLDTELQLGSIGLMLLIVCVAMAWILVIVRLRSSGMGTVFGLATLSSLTLISFTETTFLNPMDLQWFLVVLLAAKAAIGDENTSEVLDEERLSRPASTGHFDGNTFTFRTDWDREG
jgi:exopolysaccharide production protein ExoQ